MTELFVDKYELVNKRRTFVSPLEQYEVERFAYDPQPNIYGDRTNYCHKCVIRKRSTGEVIITLNRYRDDAKCTFFLRENREWLFVGIYEPEIVDLDNGTVHEVPALDEPFAGHFDINPNGTLVMAECTSNGYCHEYLFYDMSSMEDWQLLPVLGTTFHCNLDETDNRIKTKWLDENRFEFISLRSKDEYLECLECFTVPTADDAATLDYINRYFDSHQVTDDIAYKLLLEKQGDKMVCTNIEMSDAYKRLTQYLEQFEEFREPEDDEY